MSLLSSSFAFVLPTSSRRCPASSSSGWGKRTCPPRPPPAMSFPSGDVVVTPFVGADNKNDGMVAPPQGPDFFEDVYDGDYYDGLQNEDGEDCIAPGSAVLHPRQNWGGHDGHCPHNADGGDCHLPPAHAPPRATATTTKTTTMTMTKTTRGGVCRGWSWRTPPRWQWTSSWQGGRGRWWRATTTATTMAKEAFLPYQTMPLPAAAGTMTTRHHGCGVAGGRPTEEGGDIIAGTTTTRRRGGTSSPER